MKVTAHYQDDSFQEGMLVCPKDDTSQVFLVTVPARGYDAVEDNKFWAINLTGKRVSGGNYLKSLFVPFRGEIVIEV